MQIEKNKNLFISLLLFVIIFIITIFIFPNLVKIIHKAENSAGGVFEKYVILVSIPIFVYFVILFLKSEFKKLFLLFILLLPFWGKFSSVFCIIYMGHLKIPPMTFILFIFLIFILININCKTRTKTEKKFEKLLWIFAVYGSLMTLVHSQLNLYSAFWYSIGAYWQWIALFYILSGLLTHKQYALDILRFIAYAIIIGIIFRIGSEGQSIINILPGGSRFRVSSGMQMFGPAISYGGYLAIISISDLFLIKIAKTTAKKIIWIAISLLILFEMFQTMTRGAVLAFSFFLLLLFWEAERKYIYSIIIFVICLLPLWGKYIYDLIMYRGFSITGIQNLPGVYSRLDLWKKGIGYIFSNYGFGLGTTFYFKVGSGQTSTTHNMLLAMCHSNGLYFVLIFLVMYVFVLLKGIKNSKYLQENNLYPYLVVILIAFLFFANTTSTSIMSSYPFEAIIFFYLFFFLTIFMERFINPNDKRKISRP